MSKRLVRRFLFLVGLPALLAVFIHCQFQSIPTQAIGSPPVIPMQLSEAVRADLEGIVKKQADAWNRGDIADFMNPYWHDSRLTFCSGGQTERGWENTLQRYKTKYPDRETMGTLVFSNLESQEIGADAVLMLGNWKLERDKPVEGNFSLIWKRFDGQWLIIHDHSSSKQN